MMSVSDAELIVDSLTRPAAFEAIFERHFDFVHRYCVRRIGRQLGEDAAGEVLCRAFEYRDRYDTSRPDALPWLLGIAGNVVAGNLRSSGRQAAAYERSASELNLGRLGDDDRACSDADVIQELRLVAKALLSMPAIEVETLLLYVWEHQSYADIAIALDIPVGTVRSRLNRLRQRLEDELDREGFAGAESSTEERRFDD